MSNNKIQLNEKSKQTTATTSNSIVYGAQHPPSLKPINESKKPTNLSNNNGNTTITTTTTSKFKEFEEKTFNDWDINSSNVDINSFDSTNEEDEDDNEIDNNFLKISIEDSNEVAQRIIKDHSDKQQKKNLFNKLYNKSVPQMPGKAFRQQNESSIISSSSSTNNKNIQLVHNNNTINVINTIHNLSKPSITSTTITSTASNNSNTFKYSPRDNDIEVVKLEKFKNILGANPVNLEELQKASWKGISKVYRPICWKLLSDYLPLKVELQEKTIEQKRNSYWELVNEYYSKSYLDAHQDTLRQILNDLPRMNPLMPLFQKKSVQDIFQRILYVWSVRHPASGYVQGINDLVTPFFAVFLTEYLEGKSSDIENLDICNLMEKELRQLEADCYGCMTKLLDRIQENYVFSQPGIQKQVQALDELIKRIDEPLHRHLKKNHIEFLQFAFRWMNNLLMREMPLQCTIRLWDTYHAEPFGFSDFHLYVCVAFLMRFSKDLLKQKDFQDLMLFLQNLPTRTWNSNDITLLTAEAYKLQFMFADAPKHIKSTNSNNRNNNHNNE